MRQGAEVEVEDVGVDEAAATAVEDIAAEEAAAVAEDTAAEEAVATADTAAGTWMLEEVPASGEDGVAGEATEKVAEWQL